MISLLLAATIVQALYIMCTMQVSSKPKKEGSSQKNATVECSFPKVHFHKCTLIAKRNGITGVPKNQKCYYSHPRGHRALEEQRKAVKKGYRRSLASWVIRYMPLSPGRKVLHESKTNSQVAVKGQIVILHSH
jgi:hypothetical protein